MIYLKVYKNKNFYFLVPLNTLVTKESYESAEKATGIDSFSLYHSKPTPVNKLNTKTEYDEYLKIVCEYAMSVNLHGIFSNSVAFQLVKMEPQQLNS